MTNMITHIKFFTSKFAKFSLILAFNLLRYIIFILPFILIFKSLYLCWDNNIWTFDYFSQQFISSIPFFGQIFSENIWGNNLILSLDMIRNNQNISQILFFCGLSTILAENLFDTYIIDFYSKVKYFSATGGESFVDTLSSEGGKTPWKIDTMAMTDSGSSREPSSGASSGSGSDQAGAGGGTSAVAAAGESSESPARGESSSDGNTQTIAPSSGGGESSSLNSSSKRYNSIESKHERLSRAYGHAMEGLYNDLKKLSLEMDKAENKEKWQNLKAQRDEAIETIAMVTKASTEEIEKYMSVKDSDNNAIKRNYDLLDKDNKDDGNDKPTKRK
ncbi:hypothetical protein MFIFM68171_m14 (mitochondrion) [Madurella fahalii]|uniref:Uncharacterized protein n=1 Tax=Madurella fahalii TaxID=1157608 RepID=A0ABN7CKB7_9PEZI